MIDRLRAQIQQRLDALPEEADRLRAALDALGDLPESARNAPSRNRTATATAHAGAKPARRRQTARPAAANGTPRRRSQPAAAAAPRRSSPGSTRDSVLGVLSAGEAMTAGQVATATGLARPTVSTTLSRLATSGHIEKASRGYRLAATVNK